MQIPDRETAARVVAHLRTREQAAAYVAELTGRTWTVYALDKARRARPESTAGRPPFPEPISADPLLWYGPDIEAWVPYAFPRPMPKQESASNGAT